MNLSERDLGELADLAIAAATEAGEMIARSRPEEVHHKAGGESLASQIVTEIDHQSEAIILQHLAPSLERFELGLLTEERTDDGSRHESGHFWCIDPLDGTLPFVEGVAGSAVSIALVAHDGTPWIGVVYDPAEDTVSHAIRGGGAFRNGHSWLSQPSAAGKELSVFVDRSFLRREDHDDVIAQLGQIAAGLGLRGLRLQATAGAVINACRVLENPMACYFKFPGPSGGGSLWDFAATACLFGEVGAIATDMRGGALDLNRLDSTFMNHRGALFATNADLAERIRSLR